MKLNQQILKECLHYDPLTGDFIWLHRPVEHFHDANTQKKINSRQAGTKAGKIDARGYVIIQIFGNKYRAHRLAWLYVHGVLPEEIDHKNQIRSDNRIANLLSGNHQQNMMNLPVYGNNTSGVTGVSWHKRSNKWHAYGNIDKKRVSLGYFVSFEEAKNVRQKWEAEQGFSINHGKMTSLGGC